MQTPSPAADPADATHAPLPAGEQPCGRCGGLLQFDPAQGRLVCRACGYVDEAPAFTPQELAEALHEHDYLEALRRLAAREPTLQARVVTCGSCGASERLEGHVAAQRCAFCATPLLLDQAQTQTLIKPQALVPFTKDKPAAQQVFVAWVAGRWFAPNALKRTVREPDGVQGVYLPYWTFDTLAIADYDGERGTHRREVVSRQGAQGRAVNEARTVTDWTRVAGRVQVGFDDALQAASPSIAPHLARVLDDWHLEAQRPYHDDYLAGFTVEVYRHGLEAGFESACRQFEPKVDAAIRRDIGGDAQRIRARRIHYDQIRFRHVLLPVWIGSYRFGGRSYQVVVNGQTGEVEGDRPYSAWKIGLAALGAAVVLAVMWWVGQG